jgi:hypothetical protein
VIKEAKLRLEDFQFWTVDHVSRIANGAAHKLAKLAITHSVSQVWIDSYHDCITSIVLVEQDSLLTL